jgi:serine/threonine protein kinase
MVKEARIAEYLDHPSITHYFGLFVKEVDLTNDLSEVYLVSDYVNGGLAKYYLKDNHTSQVAEKLVRVG